MIFYRDRTVNICFIIENLSDILTILIHKNEGDRSIPREIKHPRTGAVSLHYDEGYDVVIRLKDNEYRFGTYSLATAQVIFNNITTAVEEEYNNRIRNKVTDSIISSQII